MTLPFEPRYEDARLPAGAGRFLDAARGPGEAHVVFVRSPHAFAARRAIETAEAARRPGILAVVTAADMARAGIGNVTAVAPVPNGAALVVPLRPALAGDLVRHVGDAVAMVVAEREAAVRDAAELVAVADEPMDAVSDVAAALEPGAPRLWPEAPGNVALDWPGRAADLPALVSDFRPVPCRTNPLGVKGVGAAGTTASLAAVMNAIADAPPEAPEIDMPATPERVWRAIHDTTKEPPR